MTQKLRPFEDVSTGNWAPTPVYARINEEVPDLVSVASGPDPYADSFEVRLTGPGRRPASPNPRCPLRPARLTARMRKTGPCAAWATVELLQGGAVIASTLVQPADSYRDEVLDLAGAAGGITDFTDLRARVTAWSSCSSSSSSAAGGGVSVPCCEPQVPAALVGTVQNVSGCEAVAGSYAMTYTGGGVWVGGGGPTGPSLVLACFGADWAFRLECPPGTLCCHGSPPDAASCDPLALEFTNGGAGYATACAGCCTGAVKVFFTE